MVGVSWEREVIWALEAAMKQPKGEIFIIPARLDECEVPDDFQHWQWVNLYELNGYEWLMRSLKKRADSVSAKFVSFEQIEVNEFPVHVPNSSVSEFNISLLGPAGSGKTTYLTLLPFSNTAGWKIYPENQETREFHLEKIFSLKENLSYLPPTAFRSSLTYNLISPGRIQRKKYLRLNVPDVPGGDYEDLNDLDIREQIGRSNGIIILIDPSNQFDGNSRFYKMMIDKLLSVLFKFQPERNLFQHVAFCLTKMDLPDHCNHFDNPKDYCLEILGRESEKKLSFYWDLKKVNFFSTSAIGFIPGTRESNMDQDKFRLRHPPEPINLFQPFLWILGETL